MSKEVYTQNDIHENVKSTLESSQAPDFAQLSEEIDTLFDDDDWDNPIVKDEYIETLETQVKGYKEFLDYLCEECVGKNEEIIRAVSETTRVDFIGYVEGKYSIDKNGKLEVIATVPNYWGKSEKVDLHFEWQPIDNYFVHQRCQFEDDFYGFMLFPTYKQNKFYCVFYNC